MKVTMKKLLSIAIAVTMVASLSLNALALDQTITYQSSQESFAATYTVKNAIKKLDPVKINDDSFYTNPLKHVFEGNLNTTVDVSGMHRYGANLLEKNVNGSYDMGLGGMEIAANLDWSGITTNGDDAILDAFIKSDSCKKAYEKADKEEFPTFTSFTDMILAADMTSESDLSTLSFFDINIKLNGFDAGSTFRFTKPGVYMIYAENGSAIVMQPAEEYISVLVIKDEATATPSKAKVSINGKEVAFDAYNIGGNNYFKLRDVAQALSGSEKQFEVGYDAAKNAISLTTAKAYTAVGGELAAGDGKGKTAKSATAVVLKDTKEIAVTAFNIGGNNYFKLRDLGEAFDFSIGWDAKTSSITVDTKAGYVAQ